MKFLCKNTFVGCKKENKGDVVLIGLPYDGTESFRRGTAKGPEFVRFYSDSIETFSYVNDIDIKNFKILDLGNVIFKIKKPDKVVNDIYKTAEYIINRKKLPLYIGGEHLITYPIVKKYYEKYKDLNVLYFDAHADFRDNYDGNKLSHAAVARRIFEFLGSKKLYMFGIRSFEKSEYQYMKSKQIFIDTKFKKFNSVIKSIKQKPVYITIDMDVFDPSCMQAVGNPEAGGIFYDFFVNVILHGFLKLKNIVAIDVVEYSPNLDCSGSSGIFTAKIIRELLPVLNKNVKKR